MKIFGLVEMTSGLVHLPYSLPKGQAGKLNFFVPCIYNAVSVNNVLFTILFCLSLMYCLQCYPVNNVLVTMPFCQKCTIYNAISVNNVPFTMLFLSIMYYLRCHFVNNVLFTMPFSHKCTIYNAILSTMYYMQCYPVSVMSPAQKPPPE